MRRSVEEPEYEENAFQEAFKQKLQSYRAPVRAGEWSRLEETLNAENQTKRRMLAVWLAAACVTLLVLSTGIFSYLKLQQTNPGMAAKTVDKNPEKVIASVQQTNQTTLLANTKPAEENPEITENLQHLPENKTSAIVAKKARTATRLAYNKRAAFNVNSENALAANNITSPVRDNKHTNQAGNSPGRSSSLSEQEGVYAARSGNEAGASTQTETLALLTENSSAETIETVPEIGVETTTKATEPGLAAARDSESGTEKNAMVSAFKSASPAKVAAAKMPVAKNMPSAAAPQTPEYADAKALKTAELNHNGNNVEGNKTALTPEFTPTQTTEPGATPAIENPVSDSAQKATEIEPAAIAKTTPTVSESKVATTQKKTGKWQLAFSYSALKFEQNLQVNGFGNSGGSGISNLAAKNSYRFEAEREFNQNTRSAYSWQAVLKAGYNIQTNLTLQAGVNVTVLSAQTPTSYYLQKLPETSLNPANAPERPEMPVLLAVLNSPDFPNEMQDVQRDEVRVDYRYTLVGLPLTLQYHTQSAGNWNFFAGAGPGINYLVNSGLAAGAPDYQASDVLADAGNQFRRWIFGINSSAGLSFKLKTDLQLTAGLEGNYLLQSFFRENTYLEAGHPFSYGLNTGLSYQF